MLTRLIKDTRGKIYTNNYGFNILHDNSTVELYSEGGGNYRSVLYATKLLQTME